MDEFGLSESEGEEEQESPASAGSGPGLNWTARTGDDGGPSMRDSLVQLGSVAESPDRRAPGSALSGGGAPWESVDSTNSEAPPPPAGDPARSTSIAELPSYLRSPFTESQEPPATTPSHDVSSPASPAPPPPQSPDGPATEIETVGPSPGLGETGERLQQLIRDAEGNALLWADVKAGAGEVLDSRDADR